MTVDINATLGEIVAEKPARSRVFEELGLDYCCGGKQLLVEACSKKGLDPREIIIRLERDDGAGEEIDAFAMSLAELADHIEATHHDYLKREMPRLSVLCEKVGAAHGEAHPEMLEVQSIVAGFRAEIESHLWKEEHILFPLIRQIESGNPMAAASHCGSVQAPIRQMEYEHDGAGDALARLRAVTRDYEVPAGVCNTYRALMDALQTLERDMHQHIHKENNVLFPRAIAMEAQASGSE